MSNNFYHVYLLLEKYNCWYFFKKAIFENRKRQLSALVIVLVWLSQAVFSVISGLPILAGSLFFLVVLMVLVYGKWISKKYSKFNKKYEGVMYLYDSREDNIRILSVMEELKGQGNLTESFFNQAISEGKAFSLLKEVSNKWVLWSALLVMLVLTTNNSVYSFFTTLDFNRIISAVFVLGSFLLFAIRFFEIDRNKYYKIDQTNFYLKIIQYYCLEKA